jgi:hypothetical protein
MIKTKSKIKMLEFYYAIDKVFFGRALTEVKIKCCPLLKEDYLTLKGALISTMIEMSKLIEHDPKYNKKTLSEADIQITSVNMAKKARQNALKIIATERSIKILKNSVKQLIREDTKIGITKATQKAIGEKAFEIALDNLVIASMLHESNSINKINTMNGQIIEGAYKIVRSALVERAQDILDTM